jgi:peptidoglycan/xylan/chitin deacetylase (PgdA/CDA1 family)
MRMTRGAVPRSVAAAALALAVLMLGGCARATTTPAQRGTAVPSRSASATPTATAETTSQPDDPSRSSTAPAAPMRRPSAEPVFHGRTGSRLVALTFDLCETPSSPTGFDRKVVDILERGKVKATFFMGGHWAETHTAAAKELGAFDFFEIGDHSYAHPHPKELSASAFRSDTLRSQAAIEKATGRRPILYRFPYGEYDGRALREVAALGLTPIQWSVVTGDPDPGVRANAIVAEVRRTAKGGAIVIMHANGRGRHTAEALPRVVDALRARGFELVTVSELLSR